MKEIKFKHQFLKLVGQENAYLVSVRHLSIPKDSNKDLLDYDTVYTIGGKIKRVSLKDGDYIQLIFVGNKHIPFCTLRKNDEPHKFESYASSIGDKFKIVVEEE